MMFSLLNIGAGEGNRTLVFSLEVTQFHNVFKEPCRAKSGMAGFLPAILVACIIAGFSSIDVSFAKSQRAIYHAALKDVGRNPTGQKYLWCQDAVNRWLKKAGFRSTGSRAARSILTHGQSIPKRMARLGDIVFRYRKGGGHTEVFAGWANTSRTSYYAITGNSCGKRGRRYVCKRKRSINSMSRIIRVR